MVGTALTMILQSSSATVGVTMALASQGLLDFNASVAIILGENIGTTITAQLASLGAGTNARRTANAHTLFNVLGVFIIIIAFPLFTKMVVWSTSAFIHIGPPDFVMNGEAVNIARYIANSHTLFNVVNAFIFLIALPYLVKATVWLTPRDVKEAEMDELHHIKYMDAKFIDTPSVAIGQAKAEIIRMGEAVEVMYDDVIRSLGERKLKELSKWRNREDAVDILQREITQFLVQVVQKPISEEESKEVNSLLRMANNLERVGDGVENIAELGEELIGEELQLSDGGMYDYELMSRTVRDFLALVVRGIRNDDSDIMLEAQKIEDSINQMREDMRGNYLMRLQSGICTVDPGLILVDMLTSFEKIGDHCYNIAQAVAGLK